MFLLFQAILGLRVDGVMKQVILKSPALPGFLNDIRITNLRVGDSSIDLDVVRHGDEVGVITKQATNDLAVVLTK
jgi:hypothetical protein